MLVFVKRGRELKRFQKMLEEANIKLSGMVSDNNGKSARSILEYLLTGASIDGKKYDEMYEQRVIAHHLKASNGLQRDIQTTIVFKHRGN